MLAKFSVKKPLTVIMVLCMIVVLGYVSFTNMTTDLLPNMNLPYVAIVTTYMGATPEEVESSLTKPLEQTLATTGGVKTISSVSAENYSMVLLEFAQSVNMDSAIIEMSGKIDTVKSALDDSIGSPIFMKINPDMIPLVIASVSLDNNDMYGTTKVVNDTIIPAFERIEGMASVNAIGLLEKHMLITLDQNKIEKLNQKILDSIDVTLKDADKKLSDGERKYKNGKSKFEKMKAETSVQLAHSTKLITDGLIKLQTGISAISTAKTQLQTYQTVLNTIKNYIDNLSWDTQDLEFHYEKLLALVTDANALLSSALDAVNDIGNTTESPELEAAITSIRSKLQHNISDCQRVLKVLENGSPTQIHTRIKALISGAKLTLSDMESQLVTTSNELETQYENLQLQQQTLEQGKLEFSQKIADAGTELLLAKQALNLGREQYEQGKESAYKKANLSGAITTKTITALLSAENFSMPAGSISQDGTSYAVKVGDTFKDDTDMLNWELFNISADGVGAITIKDVASIAYLDNSNELYAKVNGSDGLFLTMQKQSTYSTTDVTHKIQDTVKTLESENPNLHITALSDQGEYIDVVINSVLQNLLMGGVLAVLILFLFLRNIKPTLVVAISIPSSLLFAVVLMYFTGVTLNIISLAGLALGVGMLVDNSIVVIENIYRLRALGYPIKKAAIDGTNQVGGAIIASTLTTVSVFLPIVFTTGLTRQLFTDMGLTITFSLLASLIVALTLVPTLSLKLLKKPNSEKQILTSKLSVLYEKLLTFSLKKKFVPIAISLLLLVISIFGAFKMGTEFMSVSDMKQLTITLEAPLGSSSDDARTLCDELITRLSKIDDIQTIAAMQSASSSSQISTSLLSSGGNDRAISLYVLLNKNRVHTSSEIAQTILDTTSDMKCKIDVATADSGLSMLTGTGVEIAIMGDDMDVLRELATQCGLLLESLNGTLDVSNGLEETMEELRLVVDKNKAMEQGLTVAQIYMSVADQLSNTATATNITIDDEDYPVIVAKPDSETVTCDTLADLEIAVPSTTNDSDPTTVRLGSIATITYAQTLSSIAHDNQIRTLSVTAKVDSNHNVGIVSKECEAKLKDIQIPSGYSVEVRGESTHINSALKDLLYMVLLAIGFIYMIMVAQFQSFKLPFIVMFTIPLAFTGGLIALWIFGFNLSVIAMLGFLILAGVVVNNGIVFVDYANQLYKDGKDKHAALIEAGKTRLRPILMTVLTTVLGLSTLGLAIGEGSDMLQPMAIVVIFGLLYATLLTLFIIPVLYDVFNNKPPKNTGECVDSNTATLIPTETGTESVGA